MLCNAFKPRRVLVRIWDTYVPHFGRRIRKCYYLHSHLHIVSWVYIYLQCFRQLIALLKKTLTTLSTYSNHKNTIDETPPYTTKILHFSLHIASTIIWYFYKILFLFSCSWETRLHGVRWLVCILAINVERIDIYICIIVFTFTLSWIKREASSHVLQMTSLIMWCGIMMFKQRNLMWMCYFRKVFVQVRLKGRLCFCMSDIASEWKYSSLHYNWDYTAMP